MMDIKYLLVPALLLGLLAAVIYLWTKQAIHRTRAEMEIFSAQIPRRYNTVTAMSIEQARDEANRLLADLSCFECAAAPVPAEDNLSILAPELRNLFARYETIRAVGSQSVLNRRLIAPFAWDNDEWRKHHMWQIGASHEHGLVLVKAGVEGVYDIDGMDIDDDLSVPTDASIYHWLLNAVRIYD